MDDAGYYFLYSVCYVAHLVIVYWIISMATRSSAVLKHGEAQTKLLARMAKQHGVDAKEVDYIVKQITE